MNNFIFFNVLLFSVQFVFGQTNFYVSTSGSDSNSGNSIANSWQSIQHAMDNATANSVVNVLSGTYVERVYVNVSGNANGQIIFQNYNDDVVIIDGNTTGNDDGIVSIYDQSYVTIKGFKIRNNQQLDAQGIIVEGNCQNIEILDNEIWDIHFSTDPNQTANASRNSQPLIIYGTDANYPITNLKIENNIVRDSRTGYSEALAVNGNVDGFTVKNNTVFNISNIGIDIIGFENGFSPNDQARNGIISKNNVYNCKSPYATAAGIYVDGGKDLIIEKNKVSDCQWGIEIGCESIGNATDNITVRSNIIYNNDDAGITIGGYDYPNNSGKVSNCTITNNTLFSNDNTTTGIGGITGELVVSYVENVQFENNIFYADNSSNLMMYIDNVNSQNLILNYNCYYPTNSEFDFENNFYSNFTNYKNGTLQDANSISADPLFENLSGNANNSYENLSADLNAFISNQMNQNNIPGLSACIVKGDKIVWKTALGTANFGNNTPVTTQTEFTLASISKLFTATAIAQLWQNGLLDIDADINNYLPITIVNPNFPTVPITTRQLLNHKSSLKDSEADLQLWDAIGDPIYDLDEFCEAFFVAGESLYLSSNFNSTTAPGNSNYWYSNAGFTLLGYIVEEISAMPFNQYVKQNILTPLEMHEAGWFYNEVDSTNIAMPYSYSNGQHVPYGYFSVPEYPAAMLKANVEELANFLIAYTQKGVYKNVELVNPTTFAEIVPTNMMLGFGWWGTDTWWGDNSGNFWSHGGFMNGVRTQLNYYPSDSTGLIILTNGEGSYNAIQNEIESYIPLFDLLDFSLSANSPCINSGNPSFTSSSQTDFAGNLRVQDTTVDIGAYEVGDISVAHIITSINQIAVYPNPFTDFVVVDGDFTNYSITVLNATGQIVENYDNLDAPLTIQLNQLGSGMYFIKVSNQSNSDIELIKLIKY